MAKKVDFYSPDGVAKALGIPAIQVFGMLTSGELEGHQDEWARWRIPASAVRGARQDSKPSSGPGSSTEDDAESRAAEEDEAPSGGEEETTQTVETPSGEERQQEEDRERRPPPSSIDAQSSEGETGEGLPPGDNGETPASEGPPEKTTRKSSTILGVVLGLISVAFLVAGLGLVAFYFLNQESQDTATNSSEPEGFNVPEVEAPQEPADEAAADAPADKTLWVTVPSMERIKDAPVPDTFGEDEESLKNYVGIHLQGTGFPWQEEANVYLAGHRLGYPGTSSWLSFWDLDNVKEGDQITVTDANDKEYTYRVFKEFVVEPTDVSVTKPIVGKSILTLQTCTLPNYSQRLIVQAELVKEA
jgi:sortase A